METASGELSLAIIYLPMYCNVGERKFSTVFTHLNIETALVSSYCLHAITSQFGWIEISQFTRPLPRSTNVTSVNRYYIRERDWRRKARTWGHACVSGRTWCSSACVLVSYHPSRCRAQEIKHSCAKLWALPYPLHPSIRKTRLQEVRSTSII